MSLYRKTIVYKIINLELTHYCLNLYVQRQHTTTKVTNQQLSKLNNVKMAQNAKLVLRFSKKLKFSVGSVSF